MANPLTGDFEAVLQISGSTINRLLATLHENAHTNPKLPSFPHSGTMRLGDDHALEGVRGLAHVQIAVPRVTLIHGVTDRFSLEVGVRAWFQPDPGTGPMPAFIHGTVFAQYQVHDIDSSCRGWAKNAADFLWIRVIRESVRFEGTAKDDVGLVGVLLGDAASEAAAAAAAAANVARVTRQVARLLARRFQATPHPVSKRFRRGSMRSLSTSGGAAVALPVGLSGEPMGDTHSISNVLLQGRDLAVAVHIGYIMGLTTSMLDAVKNFSLNVHVHISTGKYNPIPDFDTVYRVGVHPPSIVWEPHGNFGLFKVKVNGWANTNSIAANASFEIKQSIMLDFDAGGGHLRLTTPWPAQVVVTSSGLGSGFVADAVSSQVTKSIGPMVQSACASAQPALDAMTSRTLELSQQLQTLDAQASASIDQGEFLQDGIILRGSIGLASHDGIVIKTAKTQQEDAHTALHSWIPGGRIDRFEWTWSWSGSGESGRANFTDRFLLRRPRGFAGRWGISENALLLPGLDGFGSVCLKITGVQIDGQSGDFVTVTSTKQCKSFGFRMSTVFADRERLYLRDMPELSKDVPFPQLAELAWVALPRTRDVAGAANTLVLLVGENLDDHVTKTLVRGLEACRRFDAGLSLLLLFREGLLQKGGSALIADLEALRQKLQIATIVNEDVQGGWSRALGLCAGSQALGWALISPSGDRAWAHEGQLEPAVLASALDTHLKRSADVQSVDIQMGIELGTVLSPRDIYGSYADAIDEANEPRCPPSPLGRLGTSETLVTFVHLASAASLAHLRRLAVRGDDHEAEDELPTPLLVAVFDGASEREVQALLEQWGLDFVGVADPLGRVSDRVGVSVWPTTLRLTGDGAVSDVRVGIQQRRNRKFQETDAAL
jgi:hypothetical protein